MRRTDQRDRADVESIGRARADLPDKPEGTRSRFRATRPNSTLRSFQLASESRIVETAVAQFAEATGSAASITNVNPNIIAVIGSNISEGDGPSSALFRLLGLPQTALDTVSAFGGWGAFAGNEGQPVLSMIAADKSLAEQRLSDCLTKASFVRSACAAPRLN